MLSRVVVLIVTVVVAGVACACTDSTAMAEEGAACRQFVKESIAYQRKLAEKVKALNGRRVYLFDATGFATGLQDAVTDDAVRYKTGTVGGRAVDAVLSVSAQQSLDGAAGARLYHHWSGHGHDIHVDEHGVHI